MKLGERGKAISKREITDAESLANSSPGSYPESQPLITPKYFYILRMDPPPNAMAYSINITNHISLFTTFYGPTVPRRARPPTQYLTA